MDTNEVEAYLDTVVPAKRARDARRLVTLMTAVTGEEPRLWGTIIGFRPAPASTRSWRPS